jgi:hypothetical protein
MKITHKLITQTSYPRYDIIPYIRLYYTKDWVNKLGKITSAITFEIAWLKWMYKITIEK